MEFEELSQEKKILASRNPERMLERCNTAGCEGIIIAVQELQPEERYSEDSLVLFSPDGYTDPCRVRINGFLQPGKIIKSLNDDLIKVPRKTVVIPPAETKNTASQPLKVLTRQALAERRLLGILKEIHDKDAKRYSWCL